MAESLQNSETREHKHAYYSIQGKGENEVYATLTDPETSEPIIDPETHEPMKKITIMGDTTKRMMEGLGYKFKLVPSKEYDNWIEHSQTAHDKE